MKWCVVVTDSEREPEKVYGPFDLQIEANRWLHEYLISRTDRHGYVIRLYRVEPTTDLITSNAR